MYMPDIKNFTRAVSLKNNPRATATCRKTCSETKMAQLVKRLMGTMDPKLHFGYLQDTIR